jgi:hypothetical protein
MKDVTPDCAFGSNLAVVTTAALGFFKIKVKQIFE